MSAPYLLPYERARRSRTRGVRALLWQDLRDQEIRFEAIARNCPLAGLHVLDVGCGRADLLGYLRTRDIRPARYTGLEAQPWLVRAAKRKRYPSCRVLEADFVQEPERMQVAADVVVFSGSLNFLPSRQFYRALGHAWAATRGWLAFNFLSTPDLAGTPGLTWHRRESVLAFARNQAAKVRMDESYEEGDCTVVMRRRAGRGVSASTGWYDR